MKKIVFSVLSFIAMVSVSALSVDMSFADADVIAKGQKVAFDRKKGNCLSCHIIANGQYPGTHGPPLIFMKQRFPDKAKLRARIWDATAANPNTMMPPFGRHGILTNEEIDQITEYIYTL